MIEEARLGRLFPGPHDDRAGCHLCLDAGPEAFHRRCCDRHKWGNRGMAAAMNVEKYKLALACGRCAWMRDVSGAFIRGRVL